MTIEMICDHCQRALRIKDRFAGQRGACPKCQGIIAVPAKVTEASEGTGGIEVIPESISPRPTQRRQHKKKVEEPGVALGCATLAGTFFGGGLAAFLFQSVFGEDSLWFQCIGLAWVLLVLSAGRDCVKRIGKALIG